MKRANILLYGDNTTGKSVCMTTAPKPLFVLDLDDRPQTYMGIDGIENEIFREDSRTASAYRDLKKTLRTLENIAEKDFPYATVALDSTSALVRTMADDLLGLDGTGNNDTEGLTIAQWGAVAERLRRIFMTMKRLPCLTICISHDQLVKDDIDGSIEVVTLGYMNKAAKRTPDFFDEVYRAHVKKNRRTRQREYLLQIQRDRKYPARTSMNLRDKKGNFYPILDAEEPQNIQAILDKVAYAFENQDEVLKKLQKRDS